MSAADFEVAIPAPWETYRQMQQDGIIPFQSCDDCKQSIFYPRVLCPHCGSVKLSWRVASGAGEVYSQTFMPSRDGGGRQVLLIDMMEGFRVMGSAVGEDLQIGDPVVGRSVVAEDPDQDPALVFTRRSQ